MDLDVASDERTARHIIEGLNLEHVRTSGRRRPRLSAVVDVDSEADLLRACHLRLIGLALELRVFATRIREAGRARSTDHECLDGDGLNADVGLMIVVFEIPLWGAAGDDEAERGLTAHDRRVEALFDEQRCQFQNKIEASGIGFDLPAAGRLAWRVRYLWTACRSSRQPRREVDVVLESDDPIAGPGWIVRIRRA